jgi:integrase
MSKKKASGKKIISVSEALDLLEQEYSKNRARLKKNHIREVIHALRDVILREDFNNIWSQKWIEKFNTHKNITNVIKKAENKAKQNCSSPEAANWQKKFEITIMMAELIMRLCRVSELTDRSKIKVYLTLRQRLAVTKDEELYQLIDCYHEMLRVLAKKNFNIGTDSDDIFPYLILRLIAIDGVCDGRADWRLSHLTIDQVFLDGFPSIHIRSGQQRNGKYEHKQYSITKRSSYWLQILSQRAKRNDDKLYLFSACWRKSAKYKNAVRRKSLKVAIETLWYQACPDRQLPVKFDATMWIKMAQISFEVLGMPYMCIANMRNQLRGAQLPEYNTQESKGFIRSGEAAPLLDRQGQDMLVRIQRLFRGFDLKSTSEHDRKNLAIEIEKEIRKTMAYAQDMPIKWFHNAEWIKWLLEKKEFANLTLSTIKTHTSTISNRVLTENESSDFTTLTADGWRHLAESIACDDDYTSSSRRTSLTHLRRFHVFLRIINSGVPNIDWGSYSLRVSRHFAECAVVYPHEIDRWLHQLFTGSKEWVSAILGFYCGLRAEEIFHLTPNDFESDVRLVISRSKLDSSRRTIPVSWLIPEAIYGELLERVNQISDSHGPDSSIVDPYDKLQCPSSLSKAIGRSMKKHGLRVSKMHALRHGFASLQLIRYFMLVDPKFSRSFYKGDVCPSGCDPTHSWFQKDSLANFALVVGGMRWYNDYSQKGACIGRSIDMVPISKLLGHSNRFTSLENYMNSLQWIQRYYMNQRETRIINARWSFDS